MALSEALEELGSEVFDALAAAGHEPFHQGGDGFYILGSPDKPGEVAVTLRREGILSDLPAGAIFRRHMYRYEQALTGAGFTIVRRDEREDGFVEFPSVLYVARQPDEKDVP